MRSIVLDLQAAALDEKVRVVDLLRKALVVAKKLGVREFEEWIGNELSGYERAGTSVPEYRRIPGHLVGLNPYRGWQPIMMLGDPKVAEALSSRPCPLSIAELEDLARKGTGELFMGIPPKAEKQLLKNSSHQWPLRFQISPSSLEAILDAVRTTILNWALRLEEDGILGEGLSFSPEDRAKASAASYHVFNFNAPVSQSQIAVQSESVFQANIPSDFDLNKLRDGLPLLRDVVERLEQLEPEQRSEVEAEIRTVEAQVASPRPKRSIIKDALEAIYQVAVEAAGQVAGTAILKAVGMG